MQTRNRTVHSPFGCLFSLPIVNNTTGSPSPAYAGGLTGERRRGRGRPCTLTRDLHLKLLAGALFSLYRLANNGSGFRPPPIALVLALPRDARFPFERFHHLVADTQIHLHTQTHTHMHKHSYKRPFPFHLVHSRSQKASFCGHGRENPWQNCDK